MDWWQALVLGVVQGLAEFLPISSSGHLEIFQTVIGLKLDGAKALNFDITLHVATVLSTILVLWHEFKPLCTSFFTFKWRDPNSVYVWKLLVSCVPILIVGLFFKDAIEGLFGGNLLVVGICLLATAALLSFAWIFRTRPVELAHAPAGRDITFIDAIVIGIAQSIAVLPGLSRSGTTIATGIMLGNRREEVARFSFFMVIIPILGEALLDLKDMLFPKAVEAAEAVESVAGAVAPATPENVGMLAIIIGFISSFVVGCIACKWMINIVKKGKLIWFALYCLIVGAFCILYNVL